MLFGTVREVVIFTCAFGPFGGCWCNCSDVASDHASTDAAGFHQARCSGEILKIHRIDNMDLWQPTFATSQNMSQENDGKRRAHCPNKNFLVADGDDQLLPVVSHLHGIEQSLHLS